ncbi:MAG: cyclase family protein [Calditrichia bacterium]
MSTKTDLTQWIDVSLPLSGNIPVWPGDPPAVIERNMSIREGEICNASRIDSSLHWGTHIDAPYHLFEDKWTIDQIPLEVLIGPARVIEFPDLSKIIADHLKKEDFKNTKRLLIKTRNSDFWGESPLIFHPEFTSLTADAAEFLVEIGVKMVGIDYLSIDLYAAEDLPVHKILYRQNIVGIEGLDLRNVTPGDYQLICLPLRIKGGDGSPARVVLLRE